MKKESPAEWAERNARPLGEPPAITIFQYQEEAERFISNRIRPVIIGNCTICGAEAEYKVQLLLSTNEKSIEEIRCKDLLMDRIKNTNNQQK
jgi:hypothetical protein